MIVPRVAYILNQYPKVSHSFIRSEIAALERTGAIVDRYAMRGWHGELVDPADIAERARTRYVLRSGAMPLLAQRSQRSSGRPVRFLAAASMAVRLARGR